MGNHRLRRAWRDVSLGAATRLAAGAPGPMPAWDDGAPRRVLFLRHDKIGDMLMSTALLHAIGTAHPGLELDVLASPANAPVLEGIEGVRAVLPHAVAGARDALRLARGLRARRYDAVVDGLVLTSRVTATTAMLMAGTGAPVRLGMGGGRGQEHVYTHRVPPPDDPRAHHVDWLAQLAAPFGLAPAQVGRPTLVLSDAERARGEAAWRGDAGAAEPPSESGRPPRLLVNISAGTRHRRWADEQFAAVLAHLARRHPGVRVCVVAEPRDRASARSLAAAAGALAPATATVRDALALVAGADAVLTPDTAIAHAASAFGTPCVALMLPGTGRFAPYRTPGEVLYSPGALLPTLPAERVCAALDRVLGGVRGDA